jgi:hypothetical protein
MMPLSPLLHFSLLLVLLLLVGVASYLVAWGRYADALEREVERARLAGMRYALREAANTPTDTPAEH